MRFARLEIKSSPLGHVPVIFLRSHHLVFPLGIPPLHCTFSLDIYLSVSSSLLMFSLLVFSLLVSSLLVSALLVSALLVSAFLVSSLLVPLSPVSALLVFSLLVPFSPVYAFGILHRGILLHDIFPLEQDSVSHNIDIRICVLPNPESSVSYIMHIHLCALSNNQSK